MYHRLLMTREQAIRKREKVGSQTLLPLGCPSRLAAPAHDSSLHGMPEMCCPWRRPSRSGCSRWVIPAENTRQVSVRPEQVPLVRKAIEEYRDVKQALEANQRTESIPAPAGSRGSQRTGTPVVMRRSPPAAKFLPMASSQRRWRISGNLGCGTPIKHWKMTPCFSSFSEELAKRCRKSKTPWAQGDAR